MIQSKLCIVPFNTLADGDPKFHFIIIHLFFLKKKMSTPSRLYCLATTKLKAGPMLVPLPFTLFFG